MSEHIEKKKLLVIDPDRASTEELAGYFRDEFDILHIADAEDELELDEHDLPCLILLDNITPDFNGHEACQALKQKSYARNIPVILITDCNDLSTDSETIECVAVDFITKPYNMQKVRARLQLHLSLQDKTEELEKILIMLRKDFNGVVNILSTLIESSLRDRRGHAIRVAKICRNIGLADRMPIKERKEVEAAALLHELGQVGLSPCSSTDTGDEALSNIRSTTRSAEILIKYAGFAEVANITRHIFEDFHGGGMPAGLAGHDIPHGSRMIRVVDAFVNIREQNPDAEREAALLKIEAEAGELYDPSMVGLLFNYVKTNSGLKLKSREAVLIYELKAGMVLESDIFSKSGTKVLPKGTVLSEKHLEQIIQYHTKNPIEETTYIKS